MADGDTAQHTGIDIVTGLGGIISGTVIVPAGVSAEGSVAELYSADSLSSSVETVALGADGKFAFTNLGTNNYAIKIASGTTLLVERWFGSDGTAENATAIAVADETVFNAANVTLHAGGVIEGSLSRTTNEGNWEHISVYDVNETSIVDAVDVGWFSEGELSRQWRSKVLEPGSYALSLNNGNSELWWKDAKSFSAATMLTVAAGKTVSGIDFVKPSENSLISGVLTAPAGLEVVSATVYLSSAEYDNYLQTAEVAPDGTFSLSTRLLGDFKLKVSGQLKNGLPFAVWYGDSAQFSKATVISLPDVQTVVTGLNIVVQPVHQYQFTVTDAVTGDPIQWADTALSAVETKPDYGFTIEDGTYASAVGTAGTHSYTVRKAGYQVANGTFEIKAGAPNVIPVQLSPSSRISGMVTSSNNGVPLEKVSVNLTGVDESYYDYAYTSAGKYSFETLAPGRYRLEFRNYDGLYVGEWYENAANYETATIVTVGPDGAIVNAQLDLGGIVTGQIVDANGDPVAYANVGLAKKAGTGTFAEQGRMRLSAGTGELLGIVTQTDEQGNYRLPPLAAGEYALYIESNENQTTWYNGKETLTEADTFIVTTGITTVISTAVLPLAEGESPRAPEETLSSDFTITRQPVDISAAAGDWVSFIALASGDPRPTVQWECSKDGMVWTALDGEVQTNLYLADISDASCKNYRAVFSQGETKLISEVATLTVKAPATAPSTPDAVVASELSREQVKLSWTAPADNGAPISAYVVRVYAGGTEPIRTINAGNVNELLISGLDPDTVYEATVTAENAEGPSAESARKEFRTNPVALPGAPENLLANTASATSLNLTWSAPTDDGGAPVQDYEVTVSEGGTVVSGPTKTGGSLSLTVDGLTANTEYSVKVTAVNSKGTSTTAATATVRTPKDTPVQTVPAAPAKPVATLVGLDGISVSWVAPADGHSAIDGYTVVLRDASGKTVATQKLDAEARSFVFGKLTPGQSYTAVLTAHNAVGDSALSPASETVVLPAQAPTAPAAPTLKEATATSLEVQWLAPSSDGGAAVTGYKVSMSADTGDSSTPPTVKVVSDPAQRSLLIAGLDAHTAYSVTVEACNTVGCTASAAAVLRTLAADEEPGTDPTPTPTPTKDPAPSKTPMPTATKDPAPTTTSAGSEAPRTATSATASSAASTAATPGVTGELATTGAGPVGVLGAAALLLALAGGLLLAARRKVGSHRS